MRKTTRGDPNTEVNTLQKKRKKKREIHPESENRGMPKFRDEILTPPFTHPPVEARSSGASGRSRATATFLPLLYCGSSINMGERSTPCDNERVCVVRPEGPGVAITAGWREGREEGRMKQGSERVRRNRGGKQSKKLEDSVRGRKIHTKKQTEQRNV